MKYILALDQGTTSSRSVLFDENGNIAAISQKEFKQYFPKPGWVEHDPIEIWESQLRTIHEVVKKAGIQINQVDSIGITNQRETTVVWNRKTGKPVYNAIVWQDRRTANICTELKSKQLDRDVCEATGLVIDAYFSGTKIKWILDHIPNAREEAIIGNVIFGTIDTWLIYQLTRGQTHVTDVTNASRTMVFNIHKQEWDVRLLEILEIPPEMLPTVQPSASAFGSTSISLFGKEIPISGVGGDQQAALFGQLCHDPGMVKNTYGTGCFMLMHTGSQPVHSSNGLLTTMACTLDEKPQYALEGSVFIGGAVIQWLRDGLGIIQDSKDSEAIATSVEDNGGVYFVPAFTGLGTPHWDMFARGSIFGLTRGTTSAHLVRAALESIAFQSAELLDTMKKDSGTNIPVIRVDGGASNNNFLMQFQADLTRTPVQRPIHTESTALGVAYLAGLSTGFWTMDEIKQQWKPERMFNPHMEKDKVIQHLVRWQEAIERSKHWENADSS